MQRLSLMACVLLLASMATQAQAQNASSSSSEQPKPMVSFDVNAMDKSVDPCNDFYASRPVQVQLGLVTLKIDRLPAILGAMTQPTCGCSILGSAIGIARSTAWATSCGV